MATIQVQPAKAEKETVTTAQDGKATTSVGKVSAKLGSSDQKKGAAPGDVHQLDLDPDGNCRIKIFNDVPQDRTMFQYPYSRCYIVSSTTPAGVVYQTSGFALSGTRILTSNVHVINIEQRPGAITVERSFKITNEDGSVSLEQESMVASHFFSWGNDEKEANIGLRYCMLSMPSSLHITDSEGDDVFTTITSVLSINPQPPLQVVTRRVPTAELVTATVNDEPRRVTFGSVAEWFVTDLGGWIGRHTTTNDWDYMRGSPIFVTQESGPPNGPLVSKAWLVGIVTDAVVASNPCTVNAGLFVDDGAVQRLLDAF